VGLNVVAATGGLLEQILDQTFPVWGEGLARDAYGRYNRAQLSTPWGAANLRRFALVDDDGRLLASAKRYDLVASLEGRPVKLMGLGAVFTPEAHRGHGYAAELLRLMLDAAADEGFGLALLFSEIAPRYYEHLGFRCLPTNQVLLSVRPGKRPGPLAIAMRTGDLGDLPSIVEMNASARQGYRLALVRDSDYARFAITRKRLLAASGASGQRRVEFFVVEEGGRAAAYVVLLEVGEFAMVTECGDRDPSGARVGAMLQTILARDAASISHLRAWLPPHFLPPQVEVVAHEVPPVSMMMRPLGRQVWPAPPLEASDILWWRADAF
jgi:GNAT superfamily N-acetyltransferase